VLTPHSKVIELPKGATALDFAYAIHSDVGNRCRGAKADGSIVPLNHPLASGQTVEVLTQKNAAPSRDWLSPHHGYLHTAKARNRVRQWFKQQDFDRHVDAGRSMLEKELNRLGIAARPHLDQIGQRYNLQKGDDLLAAIGRGDLSVGQVARKVGEPKAEGRKEEKRKSQEPAPGKHPASDHAEVIVEGVQDLMTHMAQCCKPVPYDSVLGFVTRGRGVTVHRKDCVNLRKMPEQEKVRLIDVRWADQPVGATYPVDLLIAAADRKGLLRDISAVFSDEEINVIGVNTVSDRSADLAKMRFTIEVKDVNQIEHMLVKLGQIPDVLDVRRSH
jgi:GTP pyrophosphokinase